MDKRSSDASAASVEASAAAPDRCLSLREQLMREGGALVHAWLASSEAVAMHAEGRFVAANQACANLFGVADPESLCGRSILEFARTDGVNHLVQRIEDAQRARASTPFAEHKLKRQDGTPVEVEATSVSFQLGRETLVMTIARDVTEQVRARALVLHRKEALKEAQGLAKMGSWELDLVRNELTWSEQLCRIFEVDPAQFEASHDGFLACVHPGDRAMVRDLYERSAQQHEPYDVQYRLEMPDGRTKYVHERGMSYYDAQGTPVRSVRTVQDVSEKVVAERTLSERQELLQTVVDASPDWIFAKDHQFRFLIANRALAAAVGLTPSDLVGRRDTDFWPVRECGADGAVSGFHAEDLAAMAGEEVRVAREEATTANGMVVLNTLKGPLRDATGRIIGAYGYARDITDADRMEQALRTSEARLALIFNTTCDLLVLAAADPGGRLVVCAANQAFLDALEDQQTVAMCPPSVVGMGLDDVLRGLLSEGSLGRCEEERREALRSLSVRCYAVQGCVSGQTKDYDVTVTVVHDEAGAATHLLWSAHDTTTRSRAEAALRASESRYRAVVEDQTELICRFRPGGTLTFVNDAGCRFVGVSRERLLTESFLPFVVEDDLPLVKACLDSLSVDKPVAAVQHRVRLADGQIRWTRWTNRGLFDASGRLQELQSVGQDVTDQHLAAQRIMAQLEEKEVLLREIHHRVKNNLQVVASLLYLQRERSADVETALRDSSARVAAMALVHEKLYRAENLVHVDILSYTHALGVSLMSTYGIEQDRVRFDFRGAGVAFDLDRATPCALILNELMTNSLKHAFPGDRRGWIRVAFEESVGQYAITVGDDGVGAPPDVLQRDASTLGSRLVVRLVAQLRGEIERLAEPGTVYRITVGKDAHR